jgi:protein-S-isoprenylcysteine O-methyltransferase Ste14
MPSIYHYVGRGDKEMEKTTIRLVGAAVIAALTLAATSMGETPRIVLSIVIGLPSFVLMNISRSQLGKSFSIMPEARALVTTGLYSRMQHPMYVFLDLFLVSAIIGLDWPILLWAWAIVVVVQTVQGRREEKVLAAAFGADYEAYNRRTWF